MAKIDQAERLKEAMERDTGSLFFDSVRAAYSQTLIDLITEGWNICIIECDLMKSAGTLPVRQRFPERVIELGVAEQNAVSVAAGLATVGIIPFVNTFAALVSRRALDQVTVTVAFTNLNVKLMGLYSGFTTAYNGPTHQSLEDLAIFRAIPNLVIIEPGDSGELRQAVRAAVNHVGPVYIRSVRGEMPDLYGGEPPPFEIGKAIQIRPGEDATIFASGIMVHLALKARETLLKQGISARVVNVRTIKPLDEEMVLRAARETGAIVSVENHSVNGGMGSAVAELLGENLPVPIRRVGVRDRFGDTGSFEWLVQTYGMDVSDIIAATQEVVRRRQSNRALAGVEKDGEGRVRP